MARRTPPITGARRSAGSNDPKPVEGSAFRAQVRAEQPAFWPAVVADAGIAARYRGERHQFRSGWDALRCVLRLAWVTDSFFAQVCYRAEVPLRRQRVPVLPGVFHRLAIACGQVSIGPHAVVRPGVYLPHGQVVIDGFTFVGAGAVLRPFVTIGLVDGKVFGPHIGPRARIGTGAKVIGPVRVGANSQVGANAVVTSNVPAGRTAVGVPARVIT